MAKLDLRTGLVHDRFAIEDYCEFWGYQDPAIRWNGWAVPGFTREVANLIADWVNGTDVGTAWWEGQVLRFSAVDDEYVDEIRPDELGLYRFDGRTWLEAQD